MTIRKNIPRILSILVLAGLMIVTYFAESLFDDFVIRIFNMWGIYVIMVVGFDLIYGITGQFSLAQAGFAAIGAYTVALLTLPTEAKEISFLLAPPLPVIANAEWPLLPALDPRRSAGSTGRFHYWRARTAASWRLPADRHLRFL